jgi:hypothetical protein
VRNATAQLTCPNEACDAHGRPGAGNIAMHGADRKKRACAEARAVGEM